MRIPPRRVAASSGYARHDEHEPAPDVLVPAQIAARRWLTPERRLLYAILDQALNDLRIARVAEQPVMRTRASQSMRSRARVEAWFTSSDTSWLCSFENVCVVLGLDADAIRSRVLPGRPGARLARAANG